MQSDGRFGSGLPDISDERLTYWSTVPVWRLREATALLLNLDPENESIFGLAEFKDLYRRLQRAKQAEILANPLSPGVFLEWARSYNYEIKPRLLEIVPQQRPVRNWKRKYFNAKKKLKLLEEKGTDTELDKRSRTTLERLMLAVAIKYFCTSPSCNEFDEKRMEEALTFNGEPTIGRRTIGKWIRHGLERQGHLVDRARQERDEKQRKVR